MAVQQAGDGGRRCAIGEDAVDQGDGAQAYHGITAELAGVDGEKDLAGIVDDGLGNPHFLVIEVEQAAVVVDAADADDRVVDLELLDEVHGSLADDTAVAAYRTAGHQHFEVGLGAELGSDVQVIGDDLQAFVVLQFAGNGLGGGAMLMNSEA